MGSQLIKQCQKINKKKTQKLDREKNREIRVRHNADLLAAHASTGDLVVVLAAVGEVVSAGSQQTLY